MFKHRSQPAPGGKSKVSKKLIGGFTALAATAIITAGGFAAAAPADKPTKEQCQKAGISNYGQCVKDWAKNKHGYGGNQNTNININLSNLHNSVVQIIINLTN